MTNLNIIGDSGRRKSKFNPNLAEEINKQVEAEEKRLELEKKLKKKKGKKEDVKADSDSRRELVVPDFKEAMFLEGYFGREINEKVQERYGKFDVIKKITFNEQDKIIEGSNPFYCVAVQEFLPEDIRIATQADLENILKENKLALAGHYEDSSLIWRSTQDPNKYYAKDIHKQFKAKGVELEKGKAYAIPLFTLKLRDDDSSPDKLAFNITEKTLRAYFEAPILNELTQQKFSSEDIDEKSGLPKKVGNDGERKLYTRNWHEYSIKNSGLCRLYLYWGLFLYSGWDDLSFSEVDGGVVLVRAAGTTQKNSGGN